MTLAFRVSEQKRGQGKILDKLTHCDSLPSGPDWCVWSFPERGYWHLLEQMSIAANLRPGHRFIRPFWEVIMKLLNRAVGMSVIGIEIAIGIGIERDNGFCVATR